MKKIILVGLSILFFSGCMPPSHEDKTLSLPPNFIVLDDEDGHPLGRGMVVKPEIGAAPDHLFVLNKSLFYKGEKLEILVRDYERDVILFRLPKKENKAVTLSALPPNIGQKLFWFGDRTHAVIVLDQHATFETEETLKQRVILLDGAVKKGVSGSAIYDDKGVIYGMIIGTDTLNQKTYAVRSDSILELVREFE